MTMIARITKFAAAPLYNFELSRGQKIASFGQYRIVKVEAMPQEGEEVPTDVADAMRDSDILAPWLRSLEDGFRQRRDNTPDFMVYVFPGGETGKRWLQSREPLHDLREAQMFLDALLAAFRLNKPERVFIPPSLMIGAAMPNPELDSIFAGEAPVQKEHLVFMDRPPYLLKDEAVYKLRKSDLSELELLCSLAARGFTTRLEVPLRRFVGSQEKTPVEKFVDLLVSLEALYGDDDRAALAHKIAFRASTITVQSVAAREKMFKLLKQAYDRRSKILHGKAADVKWVQQNLSMVEQIVRWSLTWALRRLAKTGRVPGGRDVDTLCFENSPGQL